MKILFDGSQVEDSVPTKIINGSRYVLTEQEITAKQSEEVIFQGKNLRRILTDYRFAKETGGVTYNGKVLQTTRDAVAAWLGAFLAANANPAFTVNWKTNDGSFATYSASDIINIFAVGMQHIQKCFNAESTVLASINNYSTAQQITEAFDAAYNS